MHLGKITLAAYTLLRSRRIRIRVDCGGKIKHELARDEAADEEENG
jgi:hypothetical protein